MIVITTICGLFVYGAEPDPGFGFLCGPGGARILHDGCLRQKTKVRSQPLVFNSVTHVAGNRVYPDFNK